MKGNRHSDHERRIDMHEIIINMLNHAKSIKPGEFGTTEIYFIQLKYILILVLNM